MIEKNKLPRHVEIIMDGNGRWAKERGFSRNEGHKKGSEVVKKITNYAEKLGSISMGCRNAEIEFIPFIFSVS